MVVVLAAGALLAAPPANAKKFRYAAGPRAPEDTVLSVAEVELEPIVRKRGPRVPATNLQIASMVANTAFDRGLVPAPLDSGGHVVLAPAGSHPLNFVVEHAVLRHLARRGLVATVHRAPLPEDSSVVVSAPPGSRILEYQVASARVTYLRLVGWLPGRVRIERQVLVEGKLTLRDPRDGAVLWVGDAAYNLVDSFPRAQLALVEDARFTDLKGTPPQRNVDKLVEPVVVVAIVSGLIALFFQNRP
jgi:hypothetical protein